MKGFLIAVTILTSFLRQVEGLKLHKYPDSGGRWTVGYGHLVKPYEKIPDTISMEMAEQLLIDDAEDALYDVRKLVTVDLNPHEQAAVASWMFNLGADKIKGSNTLKALNDGDKEKFLDMLMMWNKVTVNGEKVESRGLTNRRANEVKLFRGEWYGGKKA